MLIGDIGKELQRIYKKKGITIDEACEGVCHRNSYYKTLRETSIVSKNIIGVANNLGYDVMLTLVPQKENTIDVLAKKYNVDSQLVQDIVDELVLK